MQPEISSTGSGQVRACANCGAQFTLEPADFAFYERVKVPPPGWCFDCRIVRRMSFRNERTLYKRKCGAPGHSEELISIFSEDNPQRVFDHSTWWSDSWDPLEYGMGMDFARPFLRQVKDLWTQVPDVALLNINPVNSDYCSITEGNKNCYLVFGGDFNENTAYSTYIFNSKECLDNYWVSKSEHAYETVDCISCSRLSWSRYCESCYNSAFLFNCRNCHDCFGCTNLVNGAYQIFNVQYSKEEYEAELAKLNAGSSMALEGIKKRFEEHAMRYPRRYAHIIHSVNSTGDNLENAKNCRHCFDIFGGGEDCTRTWLAYSNIKDLYDCDRVGLNTELAVDSSTIYPGSRVFYSRFTLDSHDIYYSYNSHGSSYLFGCVGLRNKQYCILNKQYSKEEYETLVPKIIEHMNAMPYMDKQGKSYPYGEFFPSELSPFAYNETIAQEIATLTPDEARVKGYVWKDPAGKNYAVTMLQEEIPDTITETDDSILQATIECAHKGSCAEQCTKAFRLISSELQFYRSMNIPVPRLCPSCRHYQRLVQRNPLRLWSRQCQCAGSGSERGGYKNNSAHFHDAGPCPSAFQTTYASERPEIIYCETCYQSEVA